MTRDSRIALCPGTFDPPTLGHIDIIRRAAQLFDTVVVGVVRAPQHKQPMFDVDERIAMLGDQLGDIANVRIEPFSSLVVDFARECGAGVLVKGLRAVSDFEWELQMGHLNAGLAPDVETVFLMSRPEFSFVSSSGVREIARFGGDVSKWVSGPVAASLSRQFSSA
jgi:pantetheine-phosphate adenylyltransferase